MECIKKSSMNDPLIPFYLSKQLFRHAPDTQNIRLPFRHTESAGLLNTDICSFTKITEQVSAKGHYGVEVITDILNSYFEAMVDCIHRCGGCLLKYGGDSIFAIFPGSAEIAIPRTIHCRERMFESLKTLNLRYESDYNIQIVIDGAIKYGEVFLNVVGDERYHLDYYLDGNAVKELFELGGIAPDGEIILAPGIESYVNLPFIPPTPDSLGDYSVGELFIPEMVRRKVKEQSFSAELRNTAVVFIQICPLEEIGQIPVEAYHEYYHKIQRVVYELDGTINKIDYSDKGYLVLITFGTPHNHTDDIERAFTCAYRIQKTPCETLSVKIGVTYSNIFAGILGAKSRYEYGIIGNAVNIAARLMSNSSLGEISFSEDLLDKVSSRFESRFIERTQVKGIREPLGIYTISGELPDSWHAMQQKYAGKRLVSYTQELQTIAGRLKEGETLMVQICGAAGSGKSFVAYSLMQELNSPDKHLDIYVMEEYNQNKQCDWLQKILSRQLLIFDLKEDFGLLENYCKTQNLGFESELTRRFFAAMLEGGADLGSEEIELVYQQLAEISSQLLKDHDLIYLDDLQWMDFSSRQIYNRALPRLLSRGTSLIVGQRPELEPYCPVGFEANYHLVQLEALDYEASRKILNLEIPVISEGALKAIYNMTQGNPLFMVEMSKVIQQHLDDRHAILAESDLKRMEKEGIISNTIDNLLINEYENLDLSAQQMLKVASIIGQAFELEELNIVSRSFVDSEYAQIIQDLSDTHIIGKKTFNPSIEYVFNHHLMRDAIYRTILLREKRMLHEKIAEFYEQKYAQNPANFLELIANHYIIAGVKDKALEYALKAGEKTARLAAYPESNYYYEKALEYVDTDLERYRLRLAMIKNSIMQGDATNAREYSEFIKRDFSHLIEWDYHLQQLRIMNFSGNYLEITEYLEAMPEELPDNDIGSSIRLRYMDALNQQNRYEEFQIQAAKTRTALQSSKDLKLKGDYLASMALLHSNRSEYAKAREYYLELETQAQDSGDQIHLRIAYSGQGIMASRTGNSQEAREYLEKALAISEKLGDRNGYSKAILDLGTLIRNAGDTEEAIKMYHKSLDTAISIGNISQQSIATYNIGEAYYYQDEYDKAMPYFERSLALAESLGDLVGKTFCYDAMGDINFRWDKLDEAEAIYNKNLILQEELQDKEGIAHTIGNLANIANTREQYELANTLYLKQSELLKEVGDLNGLGRACFNRGILYQNLGDKKKTRELLNEALKLFEQCDAQIFIDITKEQIAGLDEPENDE